MLLPLACRQLERLQGSLRASTAQLQHLLEAQAARDAEVAELREEAQCTRARLHTLQDSLAKAATRDLVALAASDPGLPPAVAQARWAVQCGPPAIVTRVPACLLSPSPVL